MPFGRRSPFEALALPGVMLAFKYSQFRQRRREAATRRIAERELSALHNKIDQLLDKLEENEAEPSTSQEDECIICISAKATMQTLPCGHKVVCRRCFVKTIQSAVCQRLLPLRCVICRTRVNRLTSDSLMWRFKESASSYSVGTKSWNSTGIPPSASSYSMGEGNNNHHYNTRSRTRVGQSSSLYSMTSGSSSLSNTSNTTSCSNTSSLSSYVESPSVSSTSSTAHNTQCMLNNSSSSSSNHQHSHHHHHHHHLSCPSGCSGAIPRKPHSSSPTPSPSCSTNTYPGRRAAKNRYVELQNRLPPIKEFRSPAKAPHSSPVHISNPRFRYSSYTKRASPREMTPPLKEPTPPRKVSQNNSYVPASSSSSSLAVSTAVGKHSAKLGLSAKVGPTAQKNPILKNGLIPPSKINNNNNNNKSNTNNNNNNSNINNNKSNNNTNSSNKNNSSSNKNSSSSSSSNNVKNNKKFDTNANHSSSSSKNYSIFGNHLNNNGNNFSSYNAKLLFLQPEDADNEMNESMELKKMEEKFNLKVEKEVRKEEKRLAKEQERLAKLWAKEEKRKIKKEAKELLLANESNKK